MAYHDAHHTGSGHGGFHRIGRFFGEERVSSFGKGRRPVVGVMSCNREVDGRPSQAVSNRFIAPLGTIAGVSALLVPALPEIADVARFAEILDGLLLTGSASNVEPSRYGAERDEADIDPARDEVSLHLAARMIDAGRPVFGICRGFQELNVLFGGTLSAAAHGHYHPEGDRVGLADLFGHGHEVDVQPGGVMADWVQPGRYHVNSVHQQGVERLGHGLRVEAVSAGDGLVEAISARPAGAQVLGVQWHPEWEVASRPAGRMADVAFFSRFGDEVRGAA